MNVVLSIHSHCMHDGFLSVSAYQIQLRGFSQPGVILEDNCSRSQVVFLVPQVKKGGGYSGSDGDGDNDGSGS